MNLRELVGKQVLGKASGKEKATLARKKTTPKPAAEAGTVGTWVELAEALNVTRRTLQNWRARLGKASPLPGADGRHRVTDWREAIAKLGLAADERIPSSERLQEAKARREELAVEKAEIALARQRGELLVAAELEVALGQLLVGLATALRHLPPSAARFVVGLKDVHQVTARLDEEVEAVLMRLEGVQWAEDVSEDEREILRRIGKRMVGALIDNESQDK
jgi:hypothetical protein